MLSYRHAYHAGSHADVLKHAVTAFIQMALTQDDEQPLAIFDTHAGAGFYDLKSQMGEKVGEWRDGVARMIDAPEPLPRLMRPWLDMVREAGPHAYPGSAAISWHLLRPQDRLVCFELHPTDHAALWDLMHEDERVEIARVDGLEELPGRLPPPERRGLVLVDPSYEIKTDYRRIPHVLAKSHRRMGNGTYILWYPVIRRLYTEQMLGDLVATGIPHQYRVELCMVPDETERGMTGSGMVIVNPPADLPAAIESALPWLVYGLGARGRSRAAWVVE